MPSMPPKAQPPIHAQAPYWIRTQPTLEREAPRNGGLPPKEQGQRPNLSGTKDSGSGARGLGFCPGYRVRAITPGVLQPPVDSRWIDCRASP